MYDCPATFYMAVVPGTTTITIQFACLLSFTFFTYRCENAPTRVYVYNVGKNSGDDAFTCWKWIEVEKERGGKKKNNNNNEEILFRVISRYVVENGKLEPSPIRIVTPVLQMERNNAFSITVFCRLENYWVNLDYKFAIPDNRIGERCVSRNAKYEWRKSFVNVYRMTRVNISGGRLSRQRFSTSGPN